MTSQRSKHTNQCRIYVPGLISLVLFFPLAMFQLYRYGAFEKSYVSEVNWYSPELTRPHDLQFPPVRDYQVLTLNGNKKDDNTKRNFAQIAIREMLAMNDTVNGLRVHFTDTARYESFVRVLDICMQEGALTYAPYKNDVWIFNRIRNLEESKRISYWICGTLSLKSNVPFSRCDTLSLPFRYDYDTRFWPILLMLVVLTGLSFRKAH